MNPGNDNQLKGRHDARDAMTSRLVKVGYGGPRVDLKRIIRTIDRLLDKV